MGDPRPTSQALHISRLVAIVIALLTLCTAILASPPPTARAAETSAGFWSFQYGGGANNYCYVNFSEVGTSFNGFMSCANGSFSGPASGTINPGTGATTATFSTFVFVTWNGTISGNTWTGTWDCGCGASGSFTGTRQQSHFTASPDPGGATVATTISTGAPDNTVVDIPAGALSADATIEVDLTALPQSPALPANTFTVAKGYSFTPSPTTFINGTCVEGDSSGEGTGGVRAVFEYDPAQMPSGVTPADLRVYIMDSTGYYLVGGYPIPSTNTVVVHLCHFSTYTLIGPTTPGADTDGDGTTDGAEVAAGTDPFRNAPFCSNDTDCDGFKGGAPSAQQGPANTNAARDNCDLAANASQLNADGNFVDITGPYALDDKTHPTSDAIGDACDADDDNDGISDADEVTGDACVTFATNPLLRDSDGDRALDGAECAIGTDPTDPGSKPALAQCGLAGDADGDKLLDRIEYCYYNSNPASTDSDGDRTVDGARDGCEAASFNGDRIVNVADMGMLANGISHAVAYNPDVDVNKDGVQNPADQGLVAGFISPGGQCP